MSALFDGRTIYEVHDEIIVLYGWTIKQGLEVIPSVILWFFDSEGKAIDILTTPTDALELVTSV